MLNSISRRDFLKLASMLPFSLSLSQFITSNTADKPNILVVIFDSWSASHTSLHGYPRKTTPNIHRMAERAIVYHNHYASGHYTYPSTASFLTGVLPWNHQGYWNNSQMRILEEYEQKNLFLLLPEYHRSAYTHNALADGLLKELVTGIENYIPKNELFLNPNSISNILFQDDSDISSLSWIQNLDLSERGYANSLFLSRAEAFFRKRLNYKYQERFPRGLPAVTHRDNFILETSIDWAVENLAQSPAPFFSYVHLLPPHSPYNTRAEFIDQFKSDSFMPVKKPHHYLGQTELTFEEQVVERRMYDEFLLYADTEFQRLMDNLSSQGLLKNTYVILTSDHGEMFERGIPHHLTPSFHKPLMHIPLLIFPPSQKERKDIHSLTTTIDVLPTILSLTGNQTPSWIEGELLPPFNSIGQSARTVFSVDFKRNINSNPLTDGTIMIRSGDYKFTNFFGTQSKYKHLPQSQYYELFDIVSDPEEINNLFDPNDPLSRNFLEIMETKLLEKDLKITQY